MTTLTYLLMDNICPCFILEFHGSDSEVSAQAEFVKDIVQQYGGTFIASTKDGH